MPVWKSNVNFNDFQQQKLEILFLDTYELLLKICKNGFSRVIKQGAF